MCQNVDLFLMNIYKPSNDKNHSCGNKFLIKDQMITKRLYYIDMKLI